MPWLLNIVYLCVLTILSPGIVWRMVRHGRYRRGLLQKLTGHLPDMAGHELVVWFHAVSVGEVLQLQHVVARFCDTSPHRWRILITTSTDTGYDLAVERFPDCTVSWFPLDFSWAVNRALDRVQPNLVVLTELEFWPGFLDTCHRRKIKTAVINARMSDGSFHRYSQARWLVKPLLNHISVVTAQSTEYAERLIALGTRPERTAVTGSVKFDGVTTDPSNEATVALRTLFCIDTGDVVIIAGSTQSPEEEMVLKAWKKLRCRYPHLRLILVPRHRERFDAVASLLARDNVRCLRRSTLDEAPRKIPKDAVILLDTIGELSACWGLADIALVGGSFGSRGGQNMLEPAAFGAAVLFGPNTWNFRDIVRLLLSQQAAIEVAAENQFETHLRQLLDDEDLRTELGLAARRIVLTQQGAIQHTVQLLLAAFAGGDSESRRTAA